MWVGMALSKAHRSPQAANPARLAAHPEVIARQARVEDLRRLVAKGEYKVSPQRLALRILVRSLGHSSER